MPHLQSRSKSCCRRAVRCQCAFSRAGHSPVQPARRRWCQTRAEDKDKEVSSTGSQGGADPESPGSDDQRGDKSLQLPREVIQRMRDVVFGFDSFFVTGVENYEANGVLFKGNLRGEPSVAFEKMQSRCQAELGDKYTLYLLQDQKEVPVVVVLPSDAVQVQGNAAVPALATLSVVATLLTTLQANGVPLQLALITLDRSVVTTDTIVNALPGAISTVAILGAHEAGHVAAAKRAGARLLPPFLIPAGLGIIGSFGGITPIKSTLRSRTELLRIGEAGPAAGTAVAAALTLLGLGLSVAKAGPLVQIQSDAFNDCILMGLVGKAVFGDVLTSYPSLFVSPLLMAGWAGLVVNGLNTVPIGELDGGRIVHGIWGRRAATRVGVVVTLALALAGFIDSLALYWLLLVLVLQRGPILPQQDEITAPKGAELALVLLTLPLLTLIPYPGDVTAAAGF